MLYYLVGISIIIIFYLCYKYNILQLFKLYTHITPNYYNIKDFPQFDTLYDNYSLIKEDVEKIITNSIHPKHRNGELMYGVEDMENYIQEVSMKEQWIHAWNTTNEKPNVNWLNYPLIYNNQPLNKTPKHTIRILQDIGNIRLAGFSLMKANSSLGEHNDDCGLLTNSLTLHYGIDVPDKCHLIVDNKSEKEENNKIIIFDSNYTHSAYNKSNKDRVILYVDFLI
jgi:hypothetical protein